MKLKDFKKLHLSLVESKVENGQLKINIINNDSIWGIFNEENFLRSISSSFFNEFPKAYKPNIIPNFPLQSGVQGHLHHNINKNEQKDNNINKKIINNYNQVLNSNNYENLIKQGNNQNNKIINNNNQIKNSNNSNNYANVIQQNNNQNNMIMNNINNDQIRNLNYNVRKIKWKIKFIF